ncbi:MAG: phosphatase PAP2 family protein [Muribaculaceae bacterium]|nr:phosphatase PAP2 family protein [Muribaculaceae bacterium]
MVEKFAVRFVIALFMLSLVFSAHCQKTVVNNEFSAWTDSTSEYKFNPTQLILPASLITVGAFGIYNGSFRQLDRYVKDKMDNLRGEHYFRADDYVRFLPAAAYLVLGSTGVKSKHSFKERVAVEVTAYMAMTALTEIGKYSFREKRPNSDARNSFPSGHTATVFTGAELMREEYGIGFGIAAYTVATGVAFLRLYNGNHWLNDVIAGAGVGILSARIGYWMLPLYQKWFKWETGGRKTQTALLPYYDHQYHNFGLNMVITM